MGKSKKAPPMAPLDRVWAIAAKPAPAEYATVGGTGPRARRSPVYKQGVAILPHGEHVQVVIRNLSASGCRIEYFQNRRLEGRILVTEPSLPLSQWGEVVWNSEGVSGIAFSDEAEE